MRIFKHTIILALLLISVTFANAQWTQVGEDIDGVNEFDYLGNSVSISSDGNIMAIGSPQFEEGNGYTQIFKKTSGDWVQIGDNIVGDSFGDESGCSVSLSSEGDIVAIGACNSGAKGNNAGNVRVYENISGTWTQIGGDINGESADDYFGYSVCISSDGSSVAIGAPQTNFCLMGGEFYGNGYTRTYKNISGEWIQVGDNIVGKAYGDGSGFSVSLCLDGNIVAIGELCRNNDYFGRVRVYENISGTWTQIGEDLDGDVNLGHFGYSVSLCADGNTIAIGSPGDNDGAVKVYKNISGSWTQLGNNISGECYDAHSGVSLNLNSDGSIVAIGSSFVFNSSDRAGFVEIYKNISNNWTQMGITIEGEEDNEGFGTSVGITSDGSTVVIGAPYNDCNGYSSGRTLVYSVNNHIIIDPVICGYEYISPSGKVFMESGTYYDTIPNSMGFDIFTINLTIHPFDLNVISSDIEMKASFNGGNYQWVLCPSFMPIGGATSQTFIPIESGYYAVIIDDGNVCVDTTECYSFPGTGVGEYEKRLSMEIYPNPTNGKFTIESREMEKVEVLDIRGKLIYKKDVEEDIITIDISGFSKGIYFVKVLSSEGYGVERIVVE